MHGQVGFLSKQLKNFAVRAIIHEDSFEGLSKSMDKYYEPKVRVPLLHAVGSLLGVTLQEIKGW
jgi:hypothetical protein